MSRIQEEMKAGIADFVERCEASNESYLRYLQQFCEEMITEDREREKDDKKDVLTGSIIIGKLMGRDVGRQKEQLRSLRQPETYRSPTSLQAIYDALKAILSKRGWYGKNILAKIEPPKSTTEKHYVLRRIGSPEKSDNVPKEKGQP